MNHNTPGRQMRAAASSHVRSPHPVLAIPADLAAVETWPVIAILNDRWRVIDDPLQWILEVRTGRPTKKATGWRGRSYCTQRSTLIRCIGKYCKEVDPAALEIIKKLPEKHIDYDDAAPKV